MGMRRDSRKEWPNDKVRFRNLSRLQTRIAPPCIFTKLPVNPDNVILQPFYNEFDQFTRVKVSILGVHCHRDRASRFRTPGRVADPDESLFSRFRGDALMSQTQQKKPCGHLLTTPGSISQAQGWDYGISASKHVNPW